jgi:hypothetical protein
MKIVKMHTFDCVYSLAGTITFSATRKIPASSSVLKIKFQCARTTFLAARPHVCAACSDHYGHIVLFCICN